MSKKYLDKDGLLYFWGKIKEKLSAKVESISIGSTPITKDENGNVNLPVYPTVPTNVGDFTNNVKYQTADDVTAAINAAVGEISGIEFVKLSSKEYDAGTGVPTITGKAGKIYLTTNSGSAPNQYDEYIWLVSDSDNNGEFEKIGTTDVDLSGYVLASDLVAITNSEIDTILTT